MKKKNKTKIYYPGWELKFFDNSKNFRNYQFQLFKNFIDKVKADGSGWVDYVWAHPTTKKQTPKSSYVIGVGENQLIGAGYYKQ